MSVEGSNHRGGPRERMAVHQPHSHSLYATPHVFLSRSLPFPAWFDAVVLGREFPGPRGCCTQHDAISAVHEIQTQMAVERSEVERNWWALAGARKAPCHVMEHFVRRRVFADRGTWRGTREERKKNKMATARSWNFRFSPHGEIRIRRCPEPSTLCRGSQIYLHVTRTQPRPCASPQQRLNPIPPPSKLRTLSKRYSGLCAAIHKESTSHSTFPRFIFIFFVDSYLVPRERWKKSSLS